MSTKSLRLLWINCRLLHPLNGGDKLRTYHMLKELKARHRVTYLCLRTEADSKEALFSASEFCHELIAIPHASVPRRSVRFYTGALRSTIAGDIPYSVQRYSSPRAAKCVQELCASGDVDLIVCDYLASM